MTFQSGRRKLSTAGAQVMCLLLCPTLLLAAAGPQVSEAHRIYARLFADYNKWVRPVHNDASTVRIEMLPTLYSIDKVDEVVEKITLNYWQILRWKDELLAWNASEFGGMTRMEVPADRIWKPDLFVYGMLVTKMMAVAQGTLVSEMRDDPPLPDVLAVVQSDGRVRLGTNQFLTAHCDFDILPFPFDVQNCTLRFGSWSYDGAQLDVYSGRVPADVSQYQTNTEWTLLSFTSRRFVYHFDNRTWPDLRYYLVVRRNPTYYLLTQVLPSSIITTLAFVGLFSPFSSVGERQEKVTMGLTTLLTMAVVLTVVSQQMPKTSTGLPFVGIYILEEIMLSALAATVTVGMMYLQKWATAGQQPVPRWLRRITFIGPAHGRLAPKTEDGLAMMSLRMKQLVNAHRHSVDGQGSQPVFVGAVCMLRNDAETQLLLSRLCHDVQQLRAHIDKLQANELRMQTWGLACLRLDLWLMALFQAVNLYLTASILFHNPQSTSVPFDHQ